MIDNSHGAWEENIVVSKAVADVCHPAWAPDEMVAECIRREICKMNYATDLHIAFTKGVKEVLGEHPVSAMAIRGDFCVFSGKSDVQLV